MRLQLDAKAKERLTEHLENRVWIGECWAGKAEKFAYRPDPEGRAQLDRRIQFVPATDLLRQPAGDPEGNKPHYLINIPFGLFPGKKPDLPLKRLLKLLCDEAFEASAQTSQEIVAKRVAVVLGINQIVSIEPSRNILPETIGDVEEVDGIAYRLFGFYWKPVWVRREDLYGNIYPLRKAYSLLKVLSSSHQNEVARSVLHALEGKSSLHPDIASQVPFRSIREVIKRSAETERFLKLFERSAPKSSIYYVVMDSDARIFRQQGSVGLLSRMDKTIADHNTPSALTHGYSAGPDELPLIRLAIEMDMAVRAAMNNVIPFSAYFPEPFSGFCVRRQGGASFLPRISFLGLGKDKAESLENRRLFQSGLFIARVFKRDAVFVADGGVTTTIPERMHTEKNEKVKELTPKAVKLKSSLESLRGLSQTHATPLKWAENIYAALDFHPESAGEARGYLSHLFQVYDPISRMWATPERFGRKVFDSVMQSYSKPLTHALKNQRDTALVRLYQLEMTKEMFDLVERAAQASGAAIHAVLRKYTA